MLNRSIKPLTYLIGGITLLTLGITSIFIGKNMLNLTIIFVSIIISLNAIIEIIQYLFNKNKDKRIIQVIIKSIINILFASFMLFNKEFVIRSFSIIVGIYLLANMIIQIINYIIYIKYHIKGRIIIIIISNFNVF